MAERVDQPRVDLLDKVTGRARYVEDLPEPPGTAFAAAIRSPFSHARILSIDSAEAERLPGVLAVLHRDRLADFGVHLGSARARSDGLFATPTDNEFVTRDKARFDGDLIGMVVAVDLRTAREATRLVDVQYELLEPVFSFDEAMAAGAPLVHEHLETNLALQESLDWGDVEAALSTADHLFEAAFTSPTIFHHPIEPAMSVLVEFSAEQMNCWLPSNNPFDTVDAASRLFGLDPEQVRVRVPAVGGNFGAKHLTPEVLVAAALSRRVGRPVKFVATEEESFRVTARHAMTFHTRVGVKADGTLAGLDVDLEVDTGAYFTGARIATTNAVNASWGGYRLPNFRARARTAYTSKVPAAMFRNTGKNQTTFAIDSVMDSLARSLGMEPVEFRLRNLLRRGERPPVSTWRRNGREAAAEFPPLDTDYSEMVGRAIEAIGWDGRVSRPLPTAAGARVARGRGLAVSVRRGSQIGEATARARLDSNGVVTIEHNAPDVGEGAHTVISVVASGTLGIPQSEVRVEEPDTANQLHFSGTSSQRTTVQMGTAVRIACDRLKGRLAEMAAAAEGGSPQEWQVEEGRLRREGQVVSLGEVAAKAPGGVIESTGSYERPDVSDVSFGSHDHWSPGVAAAEVEVDRQTGEVRVIRYAAVADAGKVLHYHSAKGQIEGGAVMGYGAALTEEMCYAEGQLLNADPFQYRLPQMGDIPEDFDVTLIENGDGPGPFGSKGIAQTSIPCAAPAIGNAIYDAVGVRLTSTPFTPEKVLRALAHDDPL